jgi:hypothetical protein
MNLTDPVLSIGRTKTGQHYRNATAEKASKPKTDKTRKFNTSLIGSPLMVMPYAGSSLRLKSQGGPGCWHYRRKCRWHATQARRCPGKAP